MMMLPLGIGGICILTSIAGTYFVRLGARQQHHEALYKGLIVTGALSAVGIAIVIRLIGRLRHAAARLADRRRRSPAAACSSARWSGLAVTGLIVVDHRILHLDRISPGAQHRADLHHRPRHQRDPGPGGLDGGDRAAGAS